MKAKGFSLIELVFSVAIMGILMAIMIPQFGRIRDQALEASVKAVALSLQTAVETYAGENFIYPSQSYSEADLASALIEDGIMTTLPKNPFTQQTYAASDQAGKITYEPISDGAGYTITAYKRDGATVLLTIQGGSSSS